MTLSNELNTLMLKHRFRPNKKMSQNFVVNTELVEELVSLAELKKSDVVLEIGSGTGFLTREIQKKSRVLAVELDKKLSELVQKELPKKNLEVFCGDFLKADLPKYNKIVSLPPYTISSKLVERILKDGFEKAVLVLQREFAEKLVAEPGFMEYGFISVLTQYYCTPRIVRTVSPESFFPKPNSFSSIVVLDFEKRFGTASNEPLFRDFLKSVFRFSNKNFANSLKCAFPFIEKGFGMDKKMFCKQISSIELKNEKTDRLSPKEFVEAFNSISH